MELASTEISRMLVNILNRKSRWHDTNAYNMILNEILMSSLNQLSSLALRAFHFTSRAKLPAFTVRFWRSFSDRDLCRF